MAYKDPEAQRAYKSAWRKANPERERAAARAYGKANREQRRVASRAYYKANLESMRVYARAYSRAYREAHPEKARAWQLANPEAVRAISHTRRARLRAAAGRFTAGQWRALVAFWSGLCAYCGMCWVLQMDHRTPISRGGTNDISNILPACRSCNSEKHTRTEAEYRAARLAQLAV